MTPTSNPSSAHIVLVRPLYSRNVGNVSRAMGNMGGGRLILIDAQCEIDFEARQGAAGSQSHLLELTQYSSWSEFLNTEQNGIRIAFCAREKKETDSVDFAERVIQIQKQPEQSLLPLYLIFGPEDHGLSNEDVHFANFICGLPTFGNFRSLNLSHAVMLALFIYKSSFTPSQNKGALTDVNLGAEVPANNEPFYFPESIIQDWLHALGFEFGERRTDVYKVLKRILLRNISSPKEMRILEAVLFQTVRKLKD